MEAPALLSLPLVFATSMLLGMRHATDADHVIAVSTIVSRERSVLRSSGIGAMWGLGHTITIFTVGSAIVFLKWSFTPVVGLSLEFTVALMLVVLGALNLAPHAAGPPMRSRLGPFFIGVVHGLAGSAAVTLLILPLIDEVSWALAYLAVFGVGTIVGMTLVTVSIAAPAAYAAARFATMQRGIRLASGALSLAFGLYLSYKVGFVDGLFSADPRWLPH
jgi:high-affinity nickel-transport protein